TGPGTYTLTGPIVNAAGCYAWLDTLDQQTGHGTVGPKVAPEPVTVVSPSITTTASQAVAVAGTGLSDTVTITGLSPDTGTVTDQLYGPAPGATSCNIPSQTWI